MKRANNLLARIQDMDNLRLAFWKAGKGKRYAHSVLTFQSDLDDQLRDLQDQIRSARVQVGNYRYFLVHEPKEREICASAFSEQVLHHALMNVCHDHFDKKLIYDCYASRVGKGTYAALDRAQVYTRRYGWYLKLDVRKFFASVHHDVLKRQLACLFKERGLLRIFDSIIDSYAASPNRGLPIGNLTSQYFANYNLSGLDHFIKEDMQVKAYVRYMDDMVLWHAEKSVLKGHKTRIEKYLGEKLMLELKPIQLNRCLSGVPFLGYRLFPYNRRLLQKSKLRFIRKIKNALHLWDEERLDDQQAAAKVLPLLAFTQQANAVALRKRVCADILGQAP
jgi:RNA-directed DNA polymerase